MSKIIHKANKEQEYAHTYPINNCTPIGGTKHKGPEHARRQQTNEDYAIENDPQKDDEKLVQDNTIIFKERLDEEHNRDLSNPNERFKAYAAELKSFDKKAFIRDILSGEKAEVKKVVAECVYEFLNEFMKHEKEKEINASSKLEKISRIFTKSDYVVHAQDGIRGKVRFANDKQVSIVWQDNIIERFSIEQANEDLLIDGFDDDIEHIVKKSIDKEIDEVIEKMEKDVLKAKSDEIKELIAFMQINELIENTAEAAKEQIKLFANMNEKSFSHYKTAIMDSSKEEKTIEKKVEDVIAKPLEKKQQPKGIKKASESQGSDEFAEFDPEDREMIKKALGRDTGSTLVDLDDNISSSMIDKTPKTAMPSLQGGGVPIQIKYNQSTGSLADQLADMGWSSTVKMF